MAVYRVEVFPRHEKSAAARNESVLAELRTAGLPGLSALHTARLFFLEGDLSSADVEHIAATLLTDSVIEASRVLTEADTVESPAEATAIEILPRPGVMDPVADSVQAELRAEGYTVESIRTGRRFELSGAGSDDEVLAAAQRVLANDCIEELVIGSVGVQPMPRPPIRPFELRHVEMRQLDHAGLKKLSRDGHLFLSDEEMAAVQEYFRTLDREPTDLELETIAQTWSEHCGHKTLKGEVTYRGDAIGTAGDGQPVEQKYNNLLADTIARATHELIEERVGPQCLSVFEDNAGVIALDSEFGVAFKVETHNHPSAIEPYGGAATGIGGCIRDIIGCGLAARPIANTDVFCVAPKDWPQEDTPSGVLHPWRVLRGIVRGVSDYGNRMGIPTVNGAVCFDPRYLGNPLVYCGCIGLIPSDKIHKAAQPGDHIVVIGGRTGRDGIHGATFSSAELTDTHATEFSHAVQIGNAIEEKRCLDAILRARDAEAGCLYTAITDCGAGGLSSAVGEMGEQVGATVDLEGVPLKYAGLRYDEIWISEAQERMVLAVPESNLEAVLAIMREEEVEATVIGTFGSSDPNTPRLVVRYEGNVVGDLSMEFLHRGIPKRRLKAEWTADAELAAAAPQPATPADLSKLPTQLEDANVACKQWIIRQYDHEVQGGSVVKPLGGPGSGPSDAAVLRPRLSSGRGIAVGCGVAAHLSDVDPYWMALNAVDEAIRNVVAVGGDPSQIAILDNFCWGNCEDPRVMGELVRACQGCYDAAKAYGTPFVSGKDSLNNEFALRDEDVQRVITRILADAEREPRAFPDPIATAKRIAERIRASKRLRVPATLLISAMAIVPRVRACVTADLKRAGNTLLLVGGMPQIGFDAQQAALVHQAIAAAIAEHKLRACHDVSDGGWLVALAEMAIGGQRGAQITAAADALPDSFGGLAAGYVVETEDAATLQAMLAKRQIQHIELGVVDEAPRITWEDQAQDLDALRTAWGA